MIKFFRKIRQRLLSENNFSKYLIYAVGEIILVVIGILIAIQLNEWRNDSINTKQKQKVLLALKTEFEVNLTRLDTVFYYQEQSFLKFIKSKDLIDSINYVTDNNILKQNLAHGGFGYSYNPVNGALRSAISSGDIHLIENERLIELLFSWEDVVKDSEEEIQRLRNYQSNSKPLREKYIRIADMYKQFFPGAKHSNHPSDYSALIKDVLLEDYVSYSFFNAFEYATELNIIKNNNLEILKLIDQELKK